MRTPWACLRGLCLSLGVGCLIAWTVSAFWTLEFDEAPCNYQAALVAGNVHFVNHRGGRWPAPSWPVETTRRCRPFGLDWNLPSWRMTTGYLHSLMPTGSTQPSFTVSRQQWIVLPLWLPCLLCCSAAGLAHRFVGRKGPDCCARCGYTTAGLPGPVCPECGGEMPAARLRSGPAAI